jgi:replicative DNA helicase
MSKQIPNDISTEEIVLGSILMEPKILVMNSDNLSPDMFYNEGYKCVCEAILQLYGKSEAVDLVTVMNQLKMNGTLETVGGAVAISQLTNRIGSTANVEHHIKILQQLMLKREMIRIGSLNVESGFDETVDVFDQIEEFQKSVIELSGVVERKKTESIATQALRARNSIDKAVEMRKEGKLAGLESGYIAEDAITGGLREPDFIVLAARPGMGKTALMLGHVYHVCIVNKKPAVVFSLEMSAEQLINRLASMEAEVSVEDMNNGHLTSEQQRRIHEAIGKISNSPLIIDDTPAITMFEFKAKARKFKMQYGIEAIFFDYLQLGKAARGFRGNREQEISFISQSMKEVAKDVRVPVMALAQLSRSVEQRGGDKIPLLSDLRESGAIEQDADLVKFLWRPEYYNIVIDEAGNDVRGLAKVIIAKHRNGRLDDYKLAFIGRYTKFTDWDAFTLSEEYKQLQPNHSFESNGSQDIDEPPF